MQVDCKKVFPTDCAIRLQKLKYNFASNNN